MVVYPNQPSYSEKYHDDFYEYRHVILSRQMAMDAKALMARRKSQRLFEHEWRAIGVQQSRGWQHYLVHKPEQHVLLFRRALGTDPQTGLADPNWQPPPDHEQEIF